MKTRSIYIDLEWFHTGKIFLIGYAYSKTKSGQMYGKQLTKENFLKLLKSVNGYIFFYGPDIGVLEREFGVNIRGKHKCVNLLKVFRQCAPNLKGYRLADFEKRFGIVRKTPEYKANIFELIKDWKDPVKRQRALLYNKEDVINLIRVKEKFFKKYKVKNADLQNYLLQ